MLHGIYELPSRSNRKYTGKYRERVWSIGYSLRGVVHIELNNGRRYVAFRSMLARTPELGMHVSKLFKPVGIIPVMSVSDYAGIVFITNLARAVSGKFVLTGTMGDFITNGR